MELSKDEVFLAFEAFQEDYKKEQIYLTKKSFPSSSKESKHTHYKNTSLENLLLYAGRARAKQFNREFSLELKDIVIPKTCPLLGIPLYKGDGVLCDNSPTLDRIDNKFGYTSSNIQVISKKANTIKNSATFEEFETIYLNWKKQKENNNCQRN